MWIIRKKKIKTIQNIISSSAPHNIVRHLINFTTFPRLGLFFEIDPATGVIMAKLQSGTVFDRDRAETEYEIHVDIEDNFQGNGSNDKLYSK